VKAMGRFAANLVRTTARIVTVAWPVALVLLLACIAGSENGTAGRLFSILLLAIFLLSIILLLSYALCAWWQIRSELPDRHSAEWKISFRRVMTELIGKWLAICVLFSVLASVIQKADNPILYGLGLGTLSTLAGKAGAYVWGNSGGENDF